MKSSKTAMINFSKAEKLVKAHEDRRLTVYDDGTGQPVGPGDTLQGHPTIGWGRALDTNGISELEAYELLQKDLARTWKEITQRQFSFWTGLSDVRKAALLDMAYNMGTGGLMKFKKMLAALQVSDFDEAAAQMEQSLWFTQTGLRAKQDYCLMKFNRWFSEDEADQYFAGVW
jgi:lysozyme